VKVGLDEDLEEKLAWLAPGFSEYRVLRESVDARKRHDPHFVYSFEVLMPGEDPTPARFEFSKVRWGDRQNPVIIGSGPAGLFAALRLVERGIPCVLLEQGSECGARLKAINRFWRYGELDPRNNVGFGEGGAGLYSDGKLITRIKSPHIAYVMDRLIQFGAPSEIRYLANPHVGSDRIRRIIPVLRDFLQKNGCEIHFDCKVTELKIQSAQTTRVTGVTTDDGREFSSDHIILATGHSAEDLFQHLHDVGVFMEGKSFAVGLRIEHPQKLINRVQYRDAAEHPKLSAANYKLTYHNKKDDFGVYSFCMCPGGYVLSSGTDAQGVVSNGMSNYHRNSPFANAAIVVTVNHPDNFGSDLWGGMKFRKELEARALSRVHAQGGTRELPAQRVVDFLEGRRGETLPGSSPSKAIGVELHDLLPRQIYTRLQEGFESFAKKIPDFMGPEAQLYGVESRTSCPLRITRNPDTLQSLSHQGLFPCGEGAGYAGGITSAACDGIRIADVIADEAVSLTATRSPGPSDYQEKEGTASPW
jgi:uncharacterized protein